VRCVVCLFDLPDDWPSPDGHVICSPCRRTLDPETEDRAGQVMTPARERN
jgi:hypothetical protein